MPDFSSIPNEIQTYFPKHGWTNNVSGVRQIRLPILRLFEYELPYCEVFSANGISGVWLQSRSPVESLRMLAVCLRDLSSEFRTLLKYREVVWSGDATINVDDPETLQRGCEAWRRSEIFLFSAFVLLRRLADQIVDATRPLWFEDWGSAPKSMKTAIRAANQGKLKSLKPRCDVDRLSNAFIERTQWFEDLRQEDGVRDILVHKDHVFKVTLSQHGTKNPWCVEASLTRLIKGELVVVDVVPVLRSSLLGLCDFMEEVCLSIASASGFGPSDVLYLTGDHEDITAFWPELCR